MRILFVTLIFILFLSENIFGQQAPIKNDSSVSGIKKLELRIQYYPVPLILHGVKIGVGFKINSHYRLNIIGAYSKMVMSLFQYDEHDNVSYNNRLKFELQIPRKFNGHPSIFVAPSLSYFQATINSYHDTSYQYDYKISISHSKVISPACIVGVYDEENHFGIELNAGVGYKFQVGDYSGNYYDSFRTYQSGISLRAEASFYFNFYKGRKKKFNLLD